MKIDDNKIQIFIILIFIIKKIKCYQNLRFKNAL